MTNEEVEKKIEFIVDQQAQLVVSQQKAAERMTALESLVGRLAAATLDRFENLAAATSDRFDNLDSKIAALVDAQIKTEEAAAVTNARLAETSERLNAFIAVVERYITGGQNGKS